MKVPLAYGPRQKFLARLEQQADLNQKVAITVPRLSFEMTGISYDAGRKLAPTTLTLKANTKDAVKKQFTPVPYNIDFELNIISKTNDEALEITPSTALEPTGDWNRIYSINAPEEDVTVRITMKAASGNASENGTAGGEGGVSVWTMTLTQQQEYIVNLGARMWPSGGVPSPAGQTGGTGIGGNGGGGSFFYQGGELLVAVGGGGGGGQDSVGGAGDGGGIGAEPDIIATGYFPFNSNTGDMPTANTTLSIELWDSAGSTLHLEQKFVNMHHSTATANPEHFRTFTTQSGSTYITGTAGDSTSRLLIWYAPLRKGFGEIPPGVITTLDSSLTPADDMSFVMKINFWRVL